LDLRRLRLASGLILFAYLTTHYLNHSLGLISREALARGAEIFQLVWRNPVGTLVLYGAVAIHMLLALWSIYQRRSFKGMTGVDWGHLLLGLSVPPLIVAHLLGTRIANHLFGTIDTYDYVLLILWVFDPQEGVIQVAALLAAWIHGCIGLRGWLRLKPWYGKAAPYLFAVALLLPTLALAGMLTATREVMRLYDQPGWFEGISAAIHFVSPDQANWLFALRRALLWNYAAVLAAVLAARWLRSWIQRRRSVAITYPDGRVVDLIRGGTILDASRQAGIPHASVCGGRGRCSTCRVHVAEGLDQLPKASPEERKVLARVGAPPNVRLACQTRPTSPVSVVPLLPASATARDAWARPGYLQGREQEVTILFADLRAFTRLAHLKLPYDTVFLLNRYFRATGMAVEQAGGHLDKFIGDGVMALFGVAGGAEEASRRALAAARGMSLNMAELNRSLGPELPEPLRIAIGIHAGPAIVGEMGYGRATTLTAIGDAVNTASRLESLAKELDAELVISADAAHHAGLATAALTRQEVMLRGRDQPLEVFVLMRAAELPEGRAAPGQDASVRISPDSP
jgi:adenylate cyclase